jgi:hypothetical protein
MLTHSPAICGSRNSSVYRANQAVNQFIKRFWPTIVAILLILLIPVSLLFLLTFDNSERVAKALLSKPHGDLNPQAVTAALLTNFPVGSSTAPLNAMIDRLKGKCHPGNFENPFRHLVPPERQGDHPTKSLYCILPVQGTICMTGSLNIKIKLDSNKNITSLEAQSVTSSC